MTVSSLNTYNSWEMAVASNPLPRMAVPVLVIRLGCDGNLSTISAARSAGGGGFEDEEAIVRLYERGALVGDSEVDTKSEQERLTQKGFVGGQHGASRATLQTQVSEKTGRI